MKKHLFVDWDRTIWDFEKNSKVALKLLFHHFKLNEHKLQFNHFHNQYIKVNARMWQEYGQGILPKEELRSRRFWQTLMDLQAPTEHFEKMADFYIASAPQQTHLIPHAKEVLNELRQMGYTIHILTNGFREAQEMKIRSTGFENLIDELICSDDVGINKPDPALFRHALKTTGAPLQDSCMIGDDYHIDYLGASNFGMKALFFNHQNATKVRKDDEYVTHWREVPNKLSWVFRI